MKRINNTALLAAASLALNGLLLAVGYSYVTKQQATPIDKMATDVTPKAKRRIAIFTPTTHPALEAIQQGFRQTLAQDPNSSYEFKVFNANNDRVLMRALAEEIVQGHFDLAFSIGASASQLIANRAREKNSPMPVVFTAVTDPVARGLVQSLEQPGGNATGVLETPEYEKQMLFLRMLKPTIKTVLFVHDPTHGGGQEKDHAALEQILQQHGITLQSLQIYQSSELYAKVRPFMTQIDAILVLKDHTIVSGIDALIKLCNVYHVPLMATDLDSGDKGAALSFGVHEIDYGIQGAQLARKIFAASAGSPLPPCIGAGGHKLKINSAVAQQQGISLSQEQINLFASVEII